MTADPAAELASLRESVRLCEEILDAQTQSGSLQDGFMAAAQLDSFRRRLRAAETAERSSTRENNGKAFADFIEEQMAKPSILDDLF